MAKTKTIGTKIDIATTFGTTKAISAATNAADCVVTLEASHGIIVGDLLEIVTCTWTGLERKVFRASVVATNDVTLEDCDTSNTTRFPAGTITGTVREITAWTRIDQRTRAFSGGGGDLTTADISDLDDYEDREIPVSRTPLTRSYPGYSDPSRSWVAAVVSASDASDTPVPGREIYTSGARMLFSAYWSFQQTPVPEDNTLRDRIDVRFANRPTVYAT